MPPPPKCYLLLDHEDLDYLYDLPLYLATCMT